MKKKGISDDYVLTTEPPEEKLQYKKICRSINYKAHNTSQLSLIFVDIDLKIN